MSPGKPSLVIADDHEDMRRLVEELLAPSFEVVASVADGVSLVAAWQHHDPGLLIVDIDMPLLNGIEAVRRMRPAGSKAAVIILTVCEEADFVTAALEAGARGYVIKNRIATDLLEAIRVVRSGREFVSPGLERGNSHDV